MNAYATLAMSLDRFKVMLAQVCDVKDLEVKSEKHTTHKKRTFQLRPRKRPIFGFYWNYEVEVTEIPDGIMVMISARPHNHFICFMETRLLQAQHVITLINSMLMLQEKGLSTADLHAII